MPGSYYLTNKNSRITADPYINPDKTRARPRRHHIFYTSIPSKRGILFFYLLYPVCILFFEYTTFAEASFAANAKLQNETVRQKIVIIMRPPIVWCWWFC